MIFAATHCDFIVGCSREIMFRYNLNLKLTVYTNYDFTGIGPAEKLNAYMLGLGLEPENPISLVVVF